MGLTLKALRANVNLSQKEAAKKLGINPSTLSSWELGKRFPTVPQIKEIERLYQTSYAAIDFLCIFSYEYIVFA